MSSSRVSIYSAYRPWQSLAESRFAFYAYDSDEGPSNLEYLIPTLPGSAKFTHLLFEMFLISYYHHRERGENLFKIRTQARWGSICRSRNCPSSTIVCRGTNESSQGHCTGNTWTKTVAWFLLDIFCDSMQSFAKLGQGTRPLIGITNYSSSERTGWPRKYFVGS